MKGRSNTSAFQKEDRFYFFVYQYVNKLYQGATVPANSGNYSSRRQPEIEMPFFVQSSNIPVGYAN